MDLVTAVMIAEGAEEASPERQREAWQHLVDTGVVWQLQGSFGRTAEDLIAEGIIRPPSLPPGAEPEPAVDWPICNAQVRRDVRAGRLEVPSEAELEEWFFDSMCPAACDCGATVEHDGYCEHGRPSWFLALGVI